MAAEGDAAEKDRASDEPGAHEILVPGSQRVLHGLELLAADDQRTGKIFLDYLRNDRMATAVAPLSSRGRPGAPVSMPIAWTQVKKGLDPARYTLRTVPALLRKQAVWEDYCDGERPLEAAIRRLGKV